MRRFGRKGAFLALGLFAAGPGFAQQVFDVQFAPGNFGTMVSGALTGDDYADYRLGARAGQEMFAELSVIDTDGHGSAYFNILPPGSDGVAIFIGSMAPNNAARMTLPESGEYTIRVYLMGNDRDAAKTVGYNLDLSIQ